MFVNTLRLATRFAQKETKKSCGCGWLCTQTPVQVGREATAIVVEMRIASSPSGLRISRALFFATTCLALLASAGKARAFNTPFATTRFRLTVYENAGADIIQFSEFRLYTKDSELIPIQNNCAQNPLKEIGTFSVADEIASKTCDGDTNTKVAAFFQDSSQDSRSKWIEIDYNVSSVNAKTVYQYEICTANDEASYPNRRPKAWYLTAKIDDSKSSTDLGDWFLLDHQTDGTLDAGSSRCKKFTTVIYAREVYRLRTTAVQPIQIGRFVWKENQIDVTDFEVYCGNDRQDAGYANLHGAHNLKESSNIIWSSNTVDNDLMLFFPRNTLLGTYTIEAAVNVADWKIYHLQDDLTWYEIHSVTGDTSTSSSRTFTVDRGPRCACLKGIGFFL